MKAYPVAVRASETSEVYGGGAGLVFPPEAFEGGTVSLDGKSPIGIRPLLELRSPFSTCQLSWPSTAKSKTLELVVLDSRAEAVVWPGLDFSWRQVTAGQKIMTAVDEQDYQLASVSGADGEAVFRALRGSFSIESTSYTWGVEIWESHDSGDVLLKTSGRPTAYMSKQSVSLLGFPYPLAGGYLKLKRTAPSTGISTFSFSIQKSTS
jgi:hypothetical protein